MTQAEKEARELVDRFKADTVIYTWGDNGYKVDIETSLQNAKNCALKCVDEKFKSINDVFGNSEISIKLMKLSEAYKKLTQVKKAIEKL